MAGYLPAPKRAKETARYADDAADGDDAHDDVKPRICHLKFVQAQRQAGRQRLTASQCSHALRRISITVYWFKIIYGSINKPSFFFFFSVIITITIMIANVVVVVIANIN